MLELTLGDEGTAAAWVGDPDPTELFEILAKVAEAYALIETTVSDVTPACASRVVTVRLTAGHDNQILSAPAVRCCARSLRSMPTAPRSVGTNREPRFHARRPVADPAESVDDKA